MKKRILLLSGHSRRAFKWGMVGEIAKRILEEDELFYLDCATVPNGFCGTQHKPHLFYCAKCRNNCMKVIKHSGIKNENILKMKKFKVPKFPTFENTLEAVDFNYEGYNLGLGATSCIMTITRDYAFDTKKWKKVLDSFFRTEYLVIKNLEELNEKYHFDEIYTFNGRMPFSYAPISFAQKHNISYAVCETGSSLQKISILRNATTHNLNDLKKDINNTYERGVGSKEEKGKIAAKWFEERRLGVIQVGDFSFTQDQKADLLPKGFDFGKENIVFFNSSIDEVYAFKGWKHPFADNENEIIDKMLEHYKDDKNKHFYLRIHPNLKRAKKKQATQIKQICELQKKYDNLTVIDPEEKIDTYALIEAASKTVTAYSTVGCEATFWGSVSILAGTSPYEDFDCAHIAHSMDELFKLIDDKTLLPKPKENTYPYGYYSHENGVPYKYFIKKSFCDGEFCGMHIVSK